MNFDKKDLATLISGVETALHKSPSDPPVRLASLSYLPADETRTGSAGSSTGTGASVLDGTPFCPRSKQTKTARHRKRNQYTLLTPENFDPKLFWTMDKVFLEAVVRTEVKLQLRTCRFKRLTLSNGLIASCRNVQRTSRGVTPAYLHARCFLFGLRQKAIIVILRMYIYFIPCLFLQGLLCKSTCTCIRFFNLSMPFIFLVKFTMLVWLVGSEFSSK